MRILPVWLTSLALAFLSLAAAPASAAGSGPIHALSRFPTVHGSTVVFEAGGNLWKVGLGGGVAQRLTSDSGYDSHPVFSPDGKWVAFTGWYQGNTDVYIVPATGGPVRRLTFHSMNNKGRGKLAPSPDNVVIGWTPDGKDVVFLSRRHSWNPQMFQAYEVPVGGGLPREIKLPWTGPLSFNASGDEVAYNQLFRNSRAFHRKHYYGGQAQNIWIYNFKKHASRQITHWKGSDTYPMWHGNTLYFASDRGPNHVMNIWAYSLKNQQFHQITHFDTYDIDWPSLGSGGIAFSDAGRLYVLKLPSQKLVKVPVRIPLDGARIQPRWKSVAKMIRGADVAPDGKLAVFSARGNLFEVPAKYGDTVNLTRSSAVDERAPAWSPDGKTIAYVTDAGGKSEIAVRPADGSGSARDLTHTSGVTYQGPLVWSPDGKWLAYSDSNQVLWVQDVASGRRFRVAQNKYQVIGGFADVSWSPDSRWLAYSNTLSNHERALFLYAVGAHKRHQVSDGSFSDSDPVFSRDGKYLYFVSARLANPAFSAFDNTLAGVDADGLYVTTLKKGTPSPFAPRSQSPVSTSSQSAGHGGQGKNKPAHPPRVAIDLDGLMQRAVRVPVPDANIAGVAAAHGIVYYLSTPEPVLGHGMPGRKPELRAYDMKKRKGMTLVSGASANGFALSADGKTLLYAKQGGWYLRPAKFSDHAKAKKLDLSHVRMRVDPRAEWAEIFREAWRDVDDYFVNPKYIAKVWPALGKKYRKLLPLVACRQDLNWVIGNMIGSLGESHMYVFGGDNGWHTPFAPTADLGVNFALNAKSGRYYLARIFRGDNTVPGYRSPLAQPGIKASKGDYVLAIDGHDLKAPENPYRFLMNTLGTAVTLKLADNPAGRHAWTVKVKPVANGSKLRLLGHIRTERARVTRLSHGKLGYVYLYDMEALGMREFMRQYYSQLTKPGIVFDERWNLGGFIDPMLFDRLTRRIVGMWVMRRGTYQQTPGPAYPGYMDAVINRGSASDGDIFAYMFKHYHLGPTIGTRTWGGVRGYDAPFTLVDGGHLVVSEVAMYGLDSKWVVENIGVMPDMRVPEPPGAVEQGHDPQLDRAVQVLMTKIKKNPRRLPPPPPWLPAFPAQPALPACPAAPACQTGTGTH